AGKQEFRFPWRGKIEGGGKASNPVVVGGKGLITQGYGPGAALLKLQSGKCEPVWTGAEKESDGRRPARHWNTPIHVDGYVYGCSGRHENEAKLRCVELATGKVMWQELNLSRSSLTLIDGHFLCLTETGVLLLLKVNPKKYEVVAKWITDL